MELASGFYETGTLSSAPSARHSELKILRKKTAQGGLSP